MIIQKPSDLRYSAITPKDVYLSRRRLLTGGAIVLGSLLAGTEAALAGTKLSGYSKSPFSTDEKMTPYKDVTNYNNFYEFGTAKEQPAEYAKNFRTSPWQVKIEGVVGKPKVLDLDAIMKLAPLEE